MCVQVSFCSTYDTLFLDTSVHIHLPVTSKYLYCIYTSETSSEFSRCVAIEYSNTFTSDDYYFLYVIFDGKGRTPLPSPLSGRDRTPPPKV